MPRGEGAKQLVHFDFTFKLLPAFCCILSTLAHPNFRRSTSVCINLTLNMTVHLDVGRISVVVERGDDHPVNGE